ncbi:cell division protein FtsK [bacterium]|nr:cell division protein FtsK [bacterium]
MPKNKEKKSENKKSKRLHKATKLSIILICLIVLMIISIFSLVNAAGSLGEFLTNIMHLALGKGAFLFPLFLLIAVISIIKNFKARKLPISISLGLILLLASLFGILHLLGNGHSDPQISWGGYLGLATSYLFLKLAGFWVSLVILGAMLIISILLIFNIPILRFQKHEEKNDIKESDLKNKKHLTPETLPELKLEQKKDKPSKLSTLVKKFTPQFKVKEIDHKSNLNDLKPVPSASIASSSAYKLPSLDLLESDKGKVTSGNIEMSKTIIEQTFKNFNIEVEMADVEIGPTVTQYTMRPALGVKLSRITALNNDLALALAAHPIRIEAPIPGKSLIGIEIPNKKNKIVRLKDLLASQEFIEEKSKSGNLGLLALGRDVAGKPRFTDLTRMPHLLVAGATGSGKTVCLNSLILSLLYQNTPEQLQFIMIDPKRVELVAYNNIPHLISPVIVDHKKALEALKWAVCEMERRFKILQSAGCRDIRSYNAKDSEPLPYIVLIVDELADLMAAHGRDAEAGIVRLAQMARAIGIHLIVSTQRPSVEVITGLIKANITSRIACQVATQIDSRTILDMAGAEKLLGNGDMLFLSGEDAKPRRIQGALVIDKEIKKVAQDWRAQGEVYDNKPEKPADSNSESAPMYSGSEIPNPDSLNQESSSLPEKKIPSDEMYDEAKQVVIESKRASASLLQRRLRIGYARAARLLDLLEASNIVGPAQGSKPRAVLVGE